MVPSYGIERNKKNQKKIQADIPLWYGLFIITVVMVTLSLNLILESLRRSTVLVILLFRLSGFLLSW